jgi:uncharacterized peroxidase-related enzyme
VLAADGIDDRLQEQLVATLLASPLDTAKLAPPERTLLEYADKLTLSPASVTAADVEALRTVGFDDRAIHDACVIIAYYAFVNRVADGLGVELEE